MTDDSPAAVGIVVVSHSSEVAEGTVRLVARLANLASDGPRLVAAGGLEDGSIGTDATRIADALAAADAGAGVVVLADLGSAVLSAATAIDELIEPDLASRVRISRGPIVEGTFVAAVQASAGDGLDGVLAAADEAASMNKLEGTLMSFVLAALLGYLLGAIPFGLIIGRLTKGIDLRQVGSHRTGATNALRTLGMRAAAAVFLLDVAKGVAAVVLGRLLFADGPAPEWAAAVAGFAAIVGHNWSFFIGFTGGRGVATSVGALGAMSPWTLLVVAPIVVLVIWRSRYVSLGSITGALAAPIVTAVLAGIGAAAVPAVAYAAASGLLVTAAHSDNIGRLRAGTERKIGRTEAVSSHG